MWNNAPMNLVLFRGAVYCALSIILVIGYHFGHVSLIILDSAGGQSLTELAADIHEMEFLRAGSANAANDADVVSTPFPTNK